MKHLILTADDFGRNHAINEAVERYFQAGFLTQASLMVNEPAVDEAVRIARRNPGLAVGLHLTIWAGRATGVSELTDAGGQFPSSAVAAGLRYFFLPHLFELLRSEIRAQFSRFSALGFGPRYWDGHGHLHLHPTILRLTLPIASEHRLSAVRLVREPGRLAFVPWVFEQLSRAAVPALRSRGIKFADRVFGLRDTGQMRMQTFARIIESLPDGTSEIYFHPGAEPSELDVPRLKSLLARNNVGLTAIA